MSHVDPFNALGGFSVGIPPKLVIDEDGNVVNNVNAPNANVTANRVYANYYYFANGDPLSIGASGSNTQVQYNFNGVLGASSAFTFNSSTSLLTVSKLQATNSANLGNIANVVILGGTNGYFLQTDGAGNLTWAPAGNGTGGNGSPGGANTQVQFNNAGNFGGDSGFTYDNTINLLTVGNVTTANITADYITLNYDVTANVVIANYLYGDGSNISNVVAVSAAVANSVAGANVTGQVNFAAVANSVAGANVTGQVGFANVANNVAAANVAGQVANALVAGTVYSANQANITSVGNLISLNVIGNITSANANLGNSVNANFYYGNFYGTANVARHVSNAAQPNITSIGTLTSLTVSGNTVLGNSVTANFFTGNLYGTANVALIANTANQANIANTAASANYAEYANNTNFTNVANYANEAFSVNASNIVGQVANALIASTVYTNAQPNITSLGTLTSLGVSGNITAANITANTGRFNGNGSGLHSIAGGNVTGQVNFAATANNVAGANVTGTVATATLATTATTATTASTVTANAQPNITSVGTLSSLSVTGNLSSGNINGGNLVSANFLTGTLTTSAQPNITSIGTLTGLNANGNIVAVNITANTGIFTGNGSGLSALNGANITGTVPSSNYATSAGSATVAGTVTTNAQPNITSVGTLSSLSVTGNISSGNINGGNLVSANFLSGTLTTATQANITTVGTLGNLIVSSNINAGNISLTGRISGNGSGLTAINGANVTGSVPSADYATDSDLANRAGTVVVNAQPNITSVGTLTSLSVTGNGIFGNVYANTGTIGANLLTGRLTTANQPNITNVGTLNSLTVSGNTSAGNINATGIISGNGSGLSSLNGANVTGTVATANYANSAATATTAGTVTTAAQPNITSVGTLSSLAVTGNITTGNLTGANLVSANFISGTLTTASQSNITTVGTLTGLNVNGNVIAQNITANTGVFTGNGSGLTSLNGANVTGTVPSANYATNAGSALTAGTVTTAAQPNITSVGTLTSLSVSGNLSAGNINGGNLISANFISGTLTTASQSNITTVGTLTGLNINGNLVAGNITSNTGVFSGNGSGLSAIAGANVTGTVATANYATSAATAGTANTVTNNAQPNITSVGTLTSLNVTGTANLGNVANVKITGGINGYVLSTDGTGNLSWTAQSNGGGNGTPGGANTQLQFNDAGSFGGSANLTWNKTSNLLLISGNATVTNTLTTTTLSATTANATNINASANITAGNVNAGNNVTANFVTGTLTTNNQPNINYLGNLGYLNVNTSVPNSNGNISFNGSMNGTGTASNITITGSLQAGNFVSATTIVGSLTTANQPNITSIGTLTSLTVSGVSNLGNVANFRLTGGVNGYVLSTDGAGNLSWVAQTGNGGGGNGTPGGANTNIQFNDNGNFAGSNKFSWNNLSDVLYVGGTTNISGNLTANRVTANSANISGNVTVGNLTGANLVSANFLSGTLTTNSQANINYLGNIAWLNVDSSLPMGNGNIRFNGSLRGVGPASDINITGNVDAGRYIQADELVGNVTTAAQPNITSLGTLTSLNVNGTANLGNVGNVKINGGSNNFVLSTDGTGNLNWVPQVSGNINPGGLNTYIQFNNSGNFDGSQFFTWNNQTRGLFIGGNANVNGFSNASVFVSNVANGIAPFVVFSSTPVPNLAVETAGTVRNAAQPNITSVGNLTALTVSGNILANNANVTNTFTAGNITTTGVIGTTNLNVTGNANLSNNVNVTGSATLTVNGKFNSAGSSNVNLGNISNIHISGGINGYVLATDGGGNLYWSAGGGGGNGTPGGSNTQIQYNDNGAFNGSAFFTFNEDTSTVQVAGNLVANTVIIGAGAFEFSQSNVFFATTSSTAANQVILSIPAANTAAVDYTIISTDVAGGIRNFIKISTVKYGNTINYVEYSTLPVNGYTGDFTVVYNPGNMVNPASIQLRLTPQTANSMTHKMMITAYKE